MISLNKIVVAVTPTVLMTPVPALAEWVGVALVSWFVMDRMVGSK